VSVGGTILTKQTYDRIENLIIGYLRAVEYVHQNPKISKEEKLQTLIEPLKELDDLLTPLHFEGKHYERWDGTYPFTQERIWKDELDLDHLHYDRDNYYIDWCENERIPKRRGPRIWIYDTEEEIQLRNERRKQREIEGRKCEPEFISHDYPGDLYQDWLPTLDAEKIQSKDLLDQVLVCYTIKRAINGDKEAFKQLYNLYEVAATRLAAKFAYRHKLSDYDEIQSTSKAFLAFIIKGFSPGRIIKDSLCNDKETILYLPGWIKDFLIYYFSQHLPPMLEDTLIEIGSVQRETQPNRFTSLYFTLLAISSPYTTISDIPWNDSPVRVRRFNNYCFRPGIVKLGPRRNLTTWIFGRRNEIETLTKADREGDTTGKAWQPYGKLYQLLRDKYKPLVKKRKKDKSFSFREVGKKEALSFVANAKFQKKLDLVEETLSEAGITHRNIEIYSKWKLEPITHNHHVTQLELAKEYDLSPRHIKRICKECKEILLKSRAHFSF